MLRSDEGKNVSIWEATGETPATNDFSPNIETDVCIIGAGIAGMTTAYLLAKAGSRVAVVDDGEIGAGETSRTTAHLAWAIDDRIYNIEKYHGEENARLAVQAHQAAIDEIERIASAENIDCDFSRLDGFLYVYPGGEQKELDDEIESCHKLGFTEVEFVERAPFADYDTGRALRFPNQGQFHIMKYINGLARAVRENGGQLFSKTHALDWKGGDAPEVKTDKGTIRAKKILLATNYPIKAETHPKEAPYRTYVIGVRVPKNSVTKALYWDTNDPYNYTRIQEEADHDVLIVGGEDHKVGQAEDYEKPFDNLESWTRERFPQAENVVYRWSGEVCETHDGLSLTGKYSDSEPNVFLHSGDSGMGMTHGTIAGMLISDLILGRENVWEKVFDPTRIATNPITEFVRENVNNVSQIADWLTAGGDVEKPEDLQNGQAAIISNGLTKIAAYRDENGALHKRSAVCRHMGCIVRWNSTEKSWDCPCHGSRYGIDGHNINAPAYEPLAPVDE